MQKSECFALGKITKTHALKGEVIIYLDVDAPEDYADLEAVFLEVKGQLVPYVIEHINIRGKKSIVKFEEFNKIEEAEAIVNADAYLPLSALPKLKGNQFYYHEVIGYNLINTESGENLGILKAIYESTGQDLFAVEIDGKEALIPVADEFIKKVNHEEKTIELLLPNGLLDIYLNP